MNANLITAQDIYIIWLFRNTAVVLVLIESFNFVSELYLFIIPASIEMHYHASEDDPFIVLIHQFIPGAEGDIALIYPPTCLVIQREGGGSKDHC